MKFQNWWVQTMPVQVRELSYGVLGVISVKLVSAASPTVGGFLLSIAMLWGMLCVFSWFADIFKWFMEPKMMDKQFGIPLKPNIPLKPEYSMST